MKSTPTHISMKQTPTEINIETILPYSQISGHNEVCNL